jgi:hypothetical protein
MNIRRIAAPLFAAALLLAASAARAEEKSLLAPDGTVFTVRAGTAVDLGVSGNGIRPDDNLIEWASLAQDGKRSLGLIPNTTSAHPKRNLDLAFDDQSASLILLWKEDLSVLNVLHLGVFKGGAWRQLDLLPSLGFAHAYNPQMLLSHQVIHWLDDEGKDAWRTRTLLSVIWWEEAHVAQARYAPIFLDEDASANDVTVYDLPALVGSTGATTYGDVPAGAFMFPSLQLQGPGAGVLASFADLATQQHYVIRIDFPTDLGPAKPSSKTWLRRRIPVVGVAMQAPLSLFAPDGGATAVLTVIGPAFNPTFLWSDDTSVTYTRYDLSTQTWSSPRTIKLSDNMSKDRAFRLVQDMATKN